MNYNNIFAPAAAAQRITLRVFSIENAIALFVFLFELGCDAYESGTIVRAWWIEHEVTHRITMTIAIAVVMSVNVMLNIIEALPAFRAAFSHAIAEFVEAYRPAARFARTVPARADWALATMFQMGV
jgi:hypothetical protein